MLTKLLIVFLGSGLFAYFGTKFMMRMDKIISSETGVESAIDAVMKIEKGTREEATNSLRNTIFGFFFVVGFVFLALIVF